MQAYTSHFLHIFCMLEHASGHIRFHSEGNTGLHTTFSACWNIHWATSSFTVKEMQAHTPHFLHARTCVRTCHISSSKVCEVTRHVSCMIENVPGMPSVIFLKIEDMQLSYVL